MNIAELTPGYVEECYRKSKLVVTVEDPIAPGHDGLCGCGLGAVLVARGLLYPGVVQISTETAAQLLELPFEDAENFGLGFDAAIDGRKQDLVTEAHRIGHAAGTHIGALVGLGVLRSTGHAYVEEELEQD